MPIILVGNKIDLREDVELLQQLKELRQIPVSKTQGLACAKKIGAVKYMECSAKTGKGLKEIFTTAAEVVVNPEIFQQQAPKEKKKSLCSLL